MTDAELRGKLLKHFHGLRHKNGGWVPVSEIIVSPNVVSREAIASVCQDLADARLIQWELFTPVMTHHALGKAKITGSGVDVVTGSRRSTLDVRFPETGPHAVPVARSPLSNAAPVLADAPHPPAEVSRQSSDRNSLSPPAISPVNAATPGELFTLRPGIWGMNVDLKVAWRRLKEWWRSWNR